ncbi:hypothetical protein N0V82_008036 [Gnomoniopsis sp. IMI 355080]|nr:hypothetical protein N0V82_008036 [Gnomoniopsis sp. IMI 355080]
MSGLALPQLPVPHKELPRYVADHPDTPIVEMLQPYRDYEAVLRQLYAQDPGNAVLQTPELNILPLFTADSTGIHIRARDFAAESEQQKQQYIMALPDDQRRATGSSAVVKSLKDFQHNFNIFSESSLSELDWSNVVAAGSSVVNCLLPVPEMYNTSKRKLREFYHEKFCPASDVDLFLYGLTDEEAIEKIRQIEAAVRDAILTETTTVRTKHAITICSEYPTRHIQIVLRIYKGISEILTGFDVDCSASAYDGKQVYCSPRALESYITQVIRIDLSRRSPSYESRISKYSHRGFEVHWPDLDRSRIDPTIFERSFKRTLGLARLLVLERLPTSTSRDQYLAKRREERGRPPVHRPYFRSLGGNIKDSHEDEIADWVDEGEVSNYHTFTLPYGVKFSARKIEKLCYTRDLLLNAEWNQPKDRQVYLHRHPAFFGRVDDVLNDCCGFCPRPETEQERQIHEEESKVYVSGRISFIKDDPGRQQIGSFNPLSAADWTDMAYVGNTARLCQDIVNGELEHVQSWLAQEGADPNTRDYTGRTPLHLAVMQGTPEIVKALVDRGARLVARLADGRTALHLAAERGNVEIVKILMDKSAANEAEEEEKQALKKKANSSDSHTPTVREDEVGSPENSDVDMMDDAQSDEEEQRSMASGSFVHLKGNVEGHSHSDAVPEENEDEPDIFDTSVVAWDAPCSALHFAIICGHEEVVQLLCQEYGGDILLPVKGTDRNGHPMAILSMVLSGNLSVQKAKSMVKTLLSLGATCAQADMNGVTALHRLVQQKASELVELLIELDKIGVKKSINHLAFVRSGISTHWPLKGAIENGDCRLVRRLLDAGAAPQVDFELWLKAAKQSCLEPCLRNGLESNVKVFETTIEQPLIVALQSPDPSVALDLIRHGADVNTMTAQSRHVLQSGWHRNQGETVLDLIRQQKERLREYEPPIASAPELQYGMDTALSKLQKGTWQYAAVTLAANKAKQDNERKLELHETEEGIRISESKWLQMKQAAIDSAVDILEQMEKEILAKGGKTFDELHPDFKQQDYFQRDPRELPKRSYEFKVDLEFFPVSDLTERRKVKYIELFEAAWNGDLDQIKALTLASWDPENNEPPLQIAVQSSNTNPFSLAYFRGHHDVAKAILEIAQAQYAAEEKPSRRYRMQDSDTSDTGDDGSEPEIYGEIVDQQLTIENIGQASMLVKSRVKPLEMLDWDTHSVLIKDSKAEELSGSPDSLVRHAIANNDRKTLRFYYDLAVYFAAKDKQADESNQFVVFTQGHFWLAVQYGRLEILADMIKWTGAGLPLEQLVQNTGVELKEIPRSYQGLTVYGKKRKDWAAAGRQVVSRSTDSTTSPLLYAAQRGSIESVEWFLSDAPLRHYREFGQSEAVKTDVRLEHLSKSPGGIDRVVSRWLGAQNDLVIHAAIMGPHDARAERLVKYLIKTHPTSLEAKDSSGMSPLALATYLGRLNLVDILIAHGADQSTKDKDWNNLVHQAIVRQPTVSDLRAFLNRLDPELRKYLLKERSNLQTSDGRTPLHRFIGSHGKYSEHSLEHTIAKLRLLLKSSDGQELEALDGGGDTPLHTLIRDKEHPAIIREVIRTNPTLLLRENAVGRTPAELAHDMFVRACVQAPSDALDDQLYAWRRNSSMADTLIHKTPQEFAQTVEDEASPDRFGHSNVQDHLRLIGKIYDVVNEFASTRPGKRRLASLNEANDVALRIGESYQGERYGWEGFKSRKSRKRSAARGPGYHKREDEDASTDEDQVETGDFVSETLPFVQSSAWEEPFSE